MSVKRIEAEQSPEDEIRHWFKFLRKQGANLTQAELADRTGIPLGTIRHFEQTGQIGFSAFLLLARELDVLHLFLALARNEEPETYHKIAKEKIISRLKDSLRMATGEADPPKIRSANGIQLKVNRWRLAGRSKWFKAPNDSSRAQ
ncbi:MAG: helix-turn-helix transcriptional regulator [Luteolibacter sp.]